MLKRLLVALLVVPLADVAVLAYVAAELLGWPATILLVVLTGLIGLLLVRAEGRHTIRRFETAVSEGRVPTDELLDGAFLVAAGAFLLTPGLVTDTIGFLFVLPPTRYPIREAVKRWVVTPYVDHKTGGFVSGDVYTFGFPNPGRDDGDVHDIDSDAYTIDVDDEG